MQYSSAQRSAFKSGALALWPGVLGTGAWGLVTGVAIVKIGLSIPLAIGMTLLVYAGSAQLAVTPLIVAGAPLWVILLTAAVVNLRFVIYSAALAPEFKSLPLLRRMFLGYIMTDLGMAVFMGRQAKGESIPNFEAFYSGGSLVNWLSWQICSLIGIVLAAQIPTSWSLDFAGTLALIALVVPLTATRPALCGAIVAGIVAVVCHPLPLKLGLVCAVIAGLASAMAAEKFFPPPQASTHAK